MSLGLNDRAGRLVESLLADATAHRVAVRTLDGGARGIDLGIDEPGGLQAGVRLAEIALAGLGQVALQPARPEFGGGPAVVVSTDHPLAACMASQYAGWSLSAGKFFALGSGPMRAAAGEEALFDEIGCRERAERVVGVLETRRWPPGEVVARIATACGIATERVTLLAAPTASLAGGLQVVARSVETALHKLHTLGYPLERVENGWGCAPLPVVAADDLTAIGRTNDAILYGGEVVLWVRDEDDHLATLGPRVPSCASHDHGEPFGAIFARYGHDFYKIDPLLFSPAVVTFVNLATGRAQRFGRFLPEVLAAGG